MDVDMGISKKLPPIPPKDQEAPPPIKQKNVLVVLINSKDQLMIEGDLVSSIDNVKQIAKDFIDNNGDGSCMDCNGKRDTKSSDNPNKAIISLQNDRGTSYGMYISVQNELIAAYNELRDELSMRKYGDLYDNLELDNKKKIKKIYPQKISEAEPKEYK
ncbi:biopolymer transport exbD protein [Ichthyobacterium seriolicida]|uniref:Biopolymer transport exbD protein n=2 Tax=Ichthyobacterium seriolicida TaxID=242600 RepID=A0A1J1E9F3_9FLAO|nr:biopolymer transport exbD protein [Ichthyobacterium seriolicida]